MAPSTRSVVDGRKEQQQKLVRKAEAAQILMQRNEHSECRKHRAAAPGNLLGFLSRQ